MRLSVRALLSLFALCVPALADVRVVSSGGPFTTIQSAVNAASDGDLVLVRAGTYPGFTIDAKGIDVVADGSVTLSGGCAVTNLPVTRVTTLVGLHIPRSTANPGTCVFFSACAGSIRVQDCDVGGSLYNNGVGISACQDVSFSRCTLLGGWFASWNSPALHVVQSRVALYDTLVSGGMGNTAHGTGYFGYTGGDGALISAGAVVFASGSRFRSGPGGAGPAGQGCAGYAIHFQSASAAVTVLDTMIEASNVQCDGPVFGGPVVTLTGNARHLSSTTLVREFQTATTSLNGQVGDQAELALASATRFRLLDAWHGVSLVREPPPQATLVLPLGPLGAGGTLAQSWSVPDLGPGVQHRRLLMQQTFLDATGQTYLGPPEIQILVDSAF